MSELQDYTQGFHIVMRHREENEEQGFEPQFSER